MKKLTILALHLGYGGIEKCISSLANMLCDEYEIEIISTYKIYDKPQFFIDEKVKIRYLISDLKPNREQFLKYLKRFKFIKAFKEGLISIKVLKQKKDKMIEAIRECNSDIIISTRDIHNDWLGKYAKPNVLKIGWEHNFHNNNRKYINKVVNSALNLDYFVLVSKNLEEFYCQKLKNTKCKTINIPNTLDYYPDSISNLKNEHIVSVGRLSIEKGYLDLIDVFSLVHSVHPNWILDIVGDGNEREKIEAKIKKYNLNDHVILHGFQDKKYINDILQNGSIYAMGSYTEAFPIVLLEASSFGLPCVAFDSAQGACEIITDNWDGYLVKNRDKEQMAKRICELISNYNRRFIMGKNAFKKSKEYSTNTIKNKWIEMMEK